MRSNKTSFLTSLIALLLSIVMFTGTTFAWFTDIAVSKNNIIQSGNLDAEMYWSDSLLPVDSTEWKDASTGAVFTYNNWEPGYTDVKYIKINNAGNLSFKWKLTIESEGEVTELSDVIDVYYLNPTGATVSSLADMTFVGTLTEVLENKPSTDGALLKGEASIVAIALHMQETAGNKYQKMSLCEEGFSVKLIATQHTAENDSFGNDYDTNSEFPFGLIVENSASSGIQNNNGLLENDTLMTSADGMITAQAFAGTALADGAERLTLKLSKVENSKANITVNENEATKSIDVHIDGVASDNTVPILVTINQLLGIGLNMGNYTLYHVEKGRTYAMTYVNDPDQVDEHNEFYYDPATGNVTMALATFSEIALVADTESKWEGGYDFKWFSPDQGNYTIANADQLAGLGKIVGGMPHNGEYAYTYTEDGQDYHWYTFEGETITLLTDIDLDDTSSDNGKVFYPIGYWNSTASYEKESGGSVSSTVYSFEGTFDGNGHTISNFYQNTWEMFGDYNDGYSGTPNHYKDAMGLFGYVVNGTIKNLTVHNFSSDGEFTPTGVIAAYAVNSTFENIAITECNPRVYNTGNGGIIGIAGRVDSGVKEDIVLRNITVDSTNKISALWGSWDVAWGGLVGMFRGNEDGATSGKQDTITFENCHVAAQIDVNNDVCANYQYYAYRYAGMFIGSIRHNTTQDGRTIPNMAGISANGCTVTYGDWMHYYYCELVANSLASYTHDHQFSRLTNADSIDVVNMKVTIDGKETDIPTSGRYNYVVVSGTHSTENATCYHFVDGKVWNHKDAGTEVINGNTIDKEDRQHYYLPFAQLFTGYSWGVSSFKIEQCAGTEISIKTGDLTITGSVDKFSAVNNAPTYRRGQIIKIGDLFANNENCGVGINASALSVTVSPLDPDDETNVVSATVSINTNDWMNSTITFGEDCDGPVKVIINDYFFCKPATIILNPVAQTPKFEAIAQNDLVAFTDLKLGDLFNYIGDEIKGDVIVEVTDSQNNKQTITVTAADWENGVIHLDKADTYTVTIKDSDHYCATTTAEFTVAKADLFDNKFDKDFLYRVGNQNEFAIKYIFGLNDGFKAENVQGLDITVETIAGNAEATFTPKSTWNDSELKFTGTGVVKVTISANNANPVEVMLEVVDAVNATSATSATANNVVLLTNVSGSFTVYNGNTVYGNGFTVTLPTSYQASYTAGYVGYITINNGNLDNIRIEGPVYPVMNIYQSQSQNASTNKEEYFYNSILINGGNCTISNSYISGSRTAICIRGGVDVVIEDTTLSGGSVANMQIAGASTVTLRNLTTVQKDENDSYSQGVIAHGMGIYVDSSTVNIIVEGELNQYNWLSYNQWKKIVGTYEGSFPQFYSSNSSASKYKPYQHTRNNETYVNMAFIFACNWDTDRLDTTLQSNSEIYKKLDGVTIQEFTGGVYSVVDQGTLTDDMYYAPEYEVTGYNPIAPKFDFDNTANYDEDDQNSASDSYCEYDKDSQTLHIGLTGSEFTLDISGASITRNGEKIAYTTYLNGKQISGNSVLLKASDGTRQMLTFKVVTNDLGFDMYGNPIEGTKEYTYNVVIELATLSFPGPVWNVDGYVAGTTTYQVGTTNCYYVYYQTSKGYGEAVPIYDGIKVNYYDKDGKLVNADLSSTQYLPKDNGVTQALNSSFTYALADGSILTMMVTGSYKSGVSSLFFTNYNGKTYVYPSDLTSDSYVRPKKNSYDFNISIKYTFTDPNGMSTETITINWFGEKANGSKINDVQWKTFDSYNGKEPSCFTPDTLITLADGTQKRVDQLSVNDKILAWDFFTGTYIEKSIALLVNHGDAVYNVANLKFSDGETLRVIAEHGVFDYDLNKFVYFTVDNMDEYIGHRFVKYDSNGNYKIVTLIDAFETVEYTSAWSITSEHSSNVFASGLLTVAPPEDFYNWIEMDGKLHYDNEQFAKDVETYGLYTYEDFAGYVTYEQFVAWNGAYLKIPVEKGYFTFEYILELIETYKQWMP